MKTIAISDVAWRTARVAAATQGCGLGELVSELILTTYPAVIPSPTTGVAVDVGSGASGEQGSSPEARVPAVRRRRTGGVAAPVETTEDPVRGAASEGSDAAPIAGLMDDGLALTGAPDDGYRGIQRTGLPAEDTASACARCSHAQAIHRDGLRCQWGPGCGCHRFVPPKEMF